MQEVSFPSEFISGDERATKMDELKELIIIHIKFYATD